MHIIIWGSTGLVGASCLRLLLKSPDVERVVAPTRKALTLSHPKLQNPLIDFERLDQAAELARGVQCGISTLGTTLRQAGSREAFRRVDHDFNLRVATQARTAGVQRWCLVSAVGASRSSPFFYSRVKGELEDDMRRLAFPELAFYRPGLLLGQRQQFRLGESLAVKASGLMNLMMVGPLADYRAIHADMIARALCHHATQPLGQASAVSVLHYPDIAALAAS